MEGDGCDQYFNLQSDTSVLNNNKQYVQHNNTTIKAYAIHNNNNITNLTAWYNQTEISHPRQSSDVQAMNIYLNKQILQVLILPLMPYGGT